VAQKEYLHLSFPPFTTEDCDKEVTELLKRKKMREEQDLGGNGETVTKIMTPPSSQE